MLGNIIFRIGIVFGDVGIIFWIPGSWDLITMVIQKDIPWFYKGVCDGFTVVSLSLDLIFVTNLSVEEKHLSDSTLVRLTIIRQWKLLCNFLMSLQIGLSEVCFESLWLKLILIFLLRINQSRLVWSILTSSRGFFNYFKKVNVDVHIGISYCQAFIFRFHQI